MSKGDIEERHATVAKLRNLMERAQGGDEGAVLDIREILDGSADLAWHFIKRPATIAEWVLIEHITKDEDLASKELLKHQLESMRIEVADAYPSPLERLLAERVVATWLEVQLFSGLYGANLGKLTRAKATTTRSAWTGRTGAISRRYARSPRCAS